MKSIVAAGTLLLVSALLFGTAAGYDTGEYAKIIIVVLGVHEKTIDNEMVEVQYGHAPNLGLQQGNFTATIRAENGTALFVFDVWDPRYQLEDFGYHQALMHHEEMEDPGMEAAYRAEGESEDVDLPIIIPYQCDIRTVELADKKTGAVLISVNVTPAVDVFDTRFPRDPDMMMYCSAEPVQPMQPWEGETGIFLIAGIILGGFLLAILAFLIRKT